METHKDAYALAGLAFRYAAEVAPSLEPWAGNVTGATVEAAHREACRLNAFYYPTCPSAGLRWPYSAAVTAAVCRAAAGTARAARDFVPTEAPLPLVRSYAHAPQVVCTATRTIALAIAAVRGIDDAHAHAEACAVVAAHVRIATV